MKKKPIIGFRIKNYYFLPKLLPSLAFLSLFPFLISLGLWQIQRGQEKIRIQQIFEKRQTQTINLNKIKIVTKDKIYSPIVIEGKFDGRHNFLLDNKIYQHRVGYEILTPFIPQNSSVAILVNRGWIPQEKNRKILPLIKTMEGNLKIEGLLIWPEKTFHFKTNPEKKWPKRIQTITPQFLQQQQLKPFLIVLDKKYPYGFIPLWKPIVLSASRHYGYAFQWFSLSLTLLISFFITQTHCCSASTPLNNIKL